MAGCSHRGYYVNRDIFIHSHILVDFSTAICWTSPFVILRVSGDNNRNQSAEGAGGLGIIMSNKVGETE